MNKVDGKNSSGTRRKVRPASTPEADENQMIYLATNLARQQMLDGTASSQVITHYLKLGTEAKKLELEKLRHENRLIAAKTEAIESSKRTEELVNNALEAFKRYSGQRSVDYDYDEYDD